MAFDLSCLLFDKFGGWFDLQIQRIVCSVPTNSSKVGVSFVVCEVSLRIMHIP